MPGGRARPGAGPHSPPAVIAGLMESQPSQSQPSRADLRARVARLDLPRLLTRGGGGTLALVGVAFAGLYLPGLVRLGLVVAGILAVRVLGEVADGPVRSVLRPALGLVVGWLALAWGLGLLSPVVAVALLVLIGAEVRLWWGYREAVEAAAEAPAPLPRDPTPDERLDALLADAPLEGLEFAEIVATMKPHMSRATVARRLKERAWRIGDGRWRARPAGVDQP